MRQVSLVVMQKKYDDMVVKELANLKYKTVYVLCQEGGEQITKKLPAKIKVVYYTKRTTLKSTIRTLIENNPKERVIPYFSGDSWSKYMIFVYNQSFGTQIDRKFFRHKNKINQLFDTTLTKTHKTFSKQELKIRSFNQLQEQFTATELIIKPLNASSSAGVFKISSSEAWERIKKKLNLGDQYVLENYLPGELYSLDFLFDGKDILILTFIKETPFVEFMEKKRLSDGFYTTYGEELEQHFRYFLPLRYNLNIKKIAPKVISFLHQTKEILKQMNYRGIIHMEYKYDPENKTVGFIERGARTGWKRDLFVRETNYFEIKNLLYDVFGKGDTSKWEPWKGIYVFKDDKKDIHLVGIKTNFIRKISLGKILAKNPNYLSLSFKDFIKNSIYKKRKILCEDIIFTVKSSENNNFFPFYQNNKTRFDYLLKLDGENFKKFKKHEVAILESLVFHDYV